MIEVDGLVKRHGALEVLQGISLSVTRGEVAAIIGPSGGGKSTFLRCLNGLERFQGGTVTIDDLRLNARDDDRTRAATLRPIRLKVGMVFQQFNLFPHRTALQNVTEAPIHVLGLEREQAVNKARALLERVGLGEKLDAMPRQLSGGQQQRVAIARALAMEPEAILFDEPTSALDPRMTAEVLSVMSDLAHDGQTMIVVTHAMAFARQVARTVHVFGGGRIVESGPSEQVFEDPREDATRQFLAELARRDGWENPASWPPRNRAKGYTPNKRPSIAGGPRPPFRVMGRCPESAGMDTPETLDWDEVRKRLFPLMRTDNRTNVLYIAREYLLLSAALTGCVLVWNGWSVGRDRDGGVPPPGGAGGRPGGDVPAPALGPGARCEPFHLVQAPAGERAGVGPAPDVPPGGDDPEVPGGPSRAPSLGERSRARSRPDPAEPPGAATLPDGERDVLAALRASVALAADDPRLSVRPGEGGESQRR